MPVPVRFSKEILEGGLLYGLERPAVNEIEEVDRQFPDISRQYCDFIREIGVGEALSSGVSVCLPYWLTDEIDDSAHVALGRSYQDLLNSMGASKPRPGLPYQPDLLVVSNTGASWRYCLQMKGESRVYTFDLADMTLEETSMDFFSFIQESIDYAAGSGQAKS